MHSVKAMEQDEILFIEAINRQGSSAEKMQGNISDVYGREKE